MYKMIVHYNKRYAYGWIEQGPKLPMAGRVPRPTGGVTRHDRRGYGGERAAAAMEMGRDGRGGEGAWR